MSYDLFFLSRSGSELPREAFADYFRTRPYYETKESQAWYANEDTDVYFSFDHTSETEPIDDEAPHSTATFNLNYFRPPYFALEAEPEVASFVTHFDLVVHDPQMQGMGDGDYSREGFLRGWNAGNAFAHRAIVSQQNGDSKIHTLPERQLITAWEWNYQRARLQDGLVEDAFVPKIISVSVDGVELSAVVWGDAIPILLPAVDAVLVARQELAPRKFFVRKNDVAVVKWAELLPIINGFPVSDHPQRHVRLLYESPPEPVLRFVKALVPTQAVIQALAFDQVLSAELVAAARNTGPSEGVTFGPADSEP